ncbi:MAG TPA: hypothetical protein PLI62_13625 [Spirochaetota bacterium]|nr:hypothetical protein [Spirochaetota bacterium]
MKLSILNYGFGIDVNSPRTATKEDSSIIAKAQKIVDSMSMGKGAIIVSEVLHTDLPNLNHRRYSAKGMPEAVQSFYNPQPTPFLMHHNDGTGGLLSDGAPDLVSVGTNLVAEFFRKKVETPNGTATGYVKVGTFVPENAMVGTQNAIELVQSRRLLGLSIGASVSDNNYRCSICGKSLYDSECEHRPGGIYDNVRCYADIYKPFYREYSGVYRPSDVFAMIRRMDVAENETDLVAGHVVCQESVAWNMNMYETGKTVYAIHADVTETVETTEDDEDTMNGITESNQAADQSVSELLAAYEKQILDKNNTIIQLAQSLKSRIETETSVSEEPGTTEDENTDTETEETVTDDSANEEHADTEETNTGESQVDVTEDAPDTTSGESETETGTEEQDHSETVTETSESDANDTGTQTVEESEQEELPVQPSYRELLSKKRASRIQSMITGTHGTRTKSPMRVKPLIAKK